MIFIKKPIRSQPYFSISWLSVFGKKVEKHGNFFLGHPVVKSIVKSRKIKASQFKSNKNEDNLKKYEPKNEDDLKNEENSKN